MLIEKVFHLVAILGGKNRANMLITTAHSERFCFSLFFMAANTKFGNRGQTKRIHLCVLQSLWE